MTPCGQVRAVDPQRVRTRRSSSLVAARVKLTAVMERGQPADLLKRRTPYRSAATVVLPAPGAASMKTRSPLARTASFCSSVRWRRGIGSAVACFVGGIEIVEERVDVVRDNKRRAFAQ